MDYDQYLEECKKIKERNYLLLDLFKDDLIQSGLKDKTISRHLSNVECSLIKDSMEVWQTDCAIYNDPESPNPFFPF